MYGLEQEHEPQFLGLDRICEVANIFFNTNHTLTSISKSLNWNVDLTLKERSSSFLSYLQDNFFSLLTKIKNSDNPHILDMGSCRGDMIQTIPRLILYEAFLSSLADCDDNLSI